MALTRRIETEWIPMPDGCRLAARLWLPDDALERPVPAVLEYIPYRSRDFTRLRDESIHQYLAEHGYAGVRVDIRGSGDSDGLLEDEYLQQELDDGVAVIHWLASQPWCNGAVGMTGFSWGGFNALQIAALRPSPLKAIITACSTDDRYADDIHCMGGCLLTDKLKWASNMFGFNSLPPDPQVVGERWRSMWQDRLEKQNPWFLEWLAHQRRDAYMRHGSVCEDYSAIQCAVYAIGGWADGYSNAIPRMLAGLSCPRKGLIGPWAHGWPHSTAPGPAIGYLQETLRWWDRWLKGRDNGIMDEPMLRVWMQDSAPPASYYETRAGRWIAEPAWPPKEADCRSWVLNAGTLDEEPREERALVNRSPQLLGLTGGEWCPYGLQAEMPIDQRCDDGLSLSFDTAPLAEALEILGAPLVDLEIAVDRPVAFLAVRLSDVARDGAATLVTLGLLNLTHDARHETVTLLEPGKRICARVQLNTIAHSFPAGNRIRLAVSTSYWPMAWPSPEPVELKLFTGSGHLRLPVRQRRPEDDSLRPFERPEQASPGRHRMITPPQRGRVIHADVGDGSTVIEACKLRGETRIDGIDLVISGRGDDTFSLLGDDPLSARHESRYTMSVQRGPMQITTRTSTVLVGTRSDFIVTATLEAYEGTACTFTRSWTRRIPREGV